MWRRVRRAGGALIGCAAMQRIVGRTIASRLPQAPGTSRSSRGETRRKAAAAHRSRARRRIGRPDTLEASVRRRMTTAIRHGDQLVNLHGSPAHTARVRKSFANDCSIRVILFRSLRAIALSRAWEWGDAVKPAARTPDSDTRRGTFVVPGCSSPRPGTCAADCDAGVTPSIAMVIPRVARTRGRAGSRP
jgi:hypothetical protein